MLGQHRLFTRQNDVRSLFLHSFLDQWQRYPWRVSSEGLEAFEQGAVPRTKKSRNALHIENMNEMTHRPLRVARSKSLVGNLGERRFVRRLVQHPIQFSLLP